MSSSARDLEIVRFVPLTGAGGYKGDRAVTDREPNGEGLAVRQVMLVDDDEDIRAVLAEALQDAGYEVDPALPAAGKRWRSCRVAVALA